MSRRGVTKVLVQSYVFDPRPNFPFRVTAKRYWADTYAGQPPSKAQDNALTLVFAHANGFHKEHWEPIIDQLFEKQEEDVSGGKHSFRIQDAWAIDAPNHGDAAILNEEVLSWGYKTFLWEDYARGVHAFLAGLGTGVDVDFSTRNLVAVGHSMGAIAVMLSTTFSPLIRFSSMHLVEPVLMGSYGEDTGGHLIEGAENRRDIWKSAEDAYQSLKNRPTWRKWDKRVLKIYTEHGLRPLPTAEYPDRKDGVTLNCTRRQEAANFRDERSYAIAYKLLPHLLNTVPTHITYGAVADFLPVECQQDVLDNASGGIKNFAGVTKVPEAGHLMVQTHPGAVADVIWRSLLQSHSTLTPRNDTLKARL